MLRVLVLTILFFFLSISLLSQNSDNNNFAKLDGIGKHERIYSWGIEIENIILHKPDVFFGFDCVFQIFSIDGTYGQCLVFIEEEINKSIEYTKKKIIKHLLKSEYTSPAEYIEFQKTFNYLDFSKCEIKRMLTKKKLLKNSNNTKNGFWIINF